MLRFLTNVWDQMIFAGGVFMNPWMLEFLIDHPKRG